MTEMNKFRFIYSSFYHNIAQIVIMALLLAATCATIWCLKHLCVWEECQAIFELEEFLEAVPWHLLNPPMCAKF